MQSFTLLLPLTLESLKQNLLDVDHAGWKKLLNDIGTKHLNKLIPDDDQLLSLITSFSIATRQHLHDIVTDLLPDRYPPNIRKLGIFFVPLYRDNGQQYLIETITSLNYMKQCDGICAGFTQTVIRHGIGENIKTFNEVLIMAHEKHHTLLYDIIEKKASWEKEEKNAEKFTQNEINFQSLCETITLFQAPNHHNELFNQPITQIYTDKISDVITPETKHSDDIVHKAYQFSGIYTKEELTLYFNLLKDIIERCHSRYTLDNRLTLELTSGIHRICLQYNTTFNIWIVGNANAQPLYAVTHTHMSEKAFKSLDFSSEDKKTHLTLNTSIYMKNSCKKFVANEFIQQLTMHSDFLALHSITQEKINITYTECDTTFNWLIIAARYGDTTLISNQLNNYPKVTLIHSAITFAAANYHLHTAKTLVLHSAKNNNTGIYALHLAILNLHDNLKYSFIDEFSTEELKDIFGKDHSTFKQSIESLTNTLIEPLTDKEIDRYFCIAALRAYRSYREEKISCCSCAFFSQNAVSSFAPKIKAAEQFESILLKYNDKKEQQDKLILSKNNLTLFDKHTLGKLYHHYFKKTLVV